MRHSFPDPLGPVSGIERPAILATLAAEPKRPQDAAPVARDVYGWAKPAERERDQSPAAEGAPPRHSGRDNDVLL